MKKTKVKNPTKHAPKKGAPKLTPEQIERASMMDKLLKKLRDEIVHRTEESVAHHSGVLWNNIVARNRAAEEAQRKRIAELEYEIGQRNALVGQRGFELRAAQEEIAVLNTTIEDLRSGDVESMRRELDAMHVELEAAKETLRKQTPGTLELESLRKAVEFERVHGRNACAKLQAELDAERAAHAEMRSKYFGEVRNRLELEIAEHAAELKQRNARSPAAKSTAGVAPKPIVTADPAAPVTVQQGADRRTLRRRFLAGDVVRSRETGERYRLKLDEVDGSDTVYLEVGQYVDMVAKLSEIELHQPVQNRAARNSMLAAHFHFWSIDAAPGAQEEFPETVRIAADQIVRDPWSTGYGMVEVVDAGAGKSAGANGVQP